MKILLSKLCCLLLLMSFLMSCKKDKSFISGTWDVYERKVGEEIITDPCYCLEPYYASGINFKTDKKFAARYQHNGVWTEQEANAGMYVDTGNKIEFYTYDAPTQTEYKTEWIVVKRTENELFIKMSANGYEVHLRKTN